MERRTLITLFLVALLVPVGFATAGGLLTDAEPASGDVAIGASDGPTVVVTGINNKIELTEFTPDSNTVEVASDAGNGTFSSNRYTHVRADNIEGTWTNLTALNVTGATLTVDPVDKAQASVSGDTDAFAYRDTIGIDDGNLDFVYSGTSGTTTVTVRGVPANANIGAVDETGTLLATATSNANGVVTLSGMANSEHKVSLTEGTRPEVSNLQPDKNLSTAPSQLSVDITDKDFANGDSVTVEFTLDGSVVDTQTVSSNGTVTTPLPSSGESLGEHTWSVDATDDYGLTDTGSASYGIPNQLRFVNESDGTLLNTITIEATFFDGDITTITTSDGTINMTGLDATDEFTVDAKPQSLYFDRTVYIVSIVDQRTVYLLRNNQSIVPSVTNRFTLRDRTGDYDGNGARLKIQKAINVSGTSEWQTIHGDEFGVSGVQTQLEKGVRYRLIVTNKDKDTRVLGTYVAEANETVPLTIGTVQGDPVAGSDGYRYNATYDNSTGTPTVRFTYNDSNVSTSELSLTIYQKGNESNVLFRNQTFTNGPYGSISVSEIVPANQSQNTWIVEAYVQRNGEQQRIREQVGPRNAVLLAIPNWLKVFISVGSIWLVAGLFSRLNGHIGGLVVAGMGGMWWFIDFLPQETGIGVVVLSLITAGILFIKERAAI